MTKASKIIAYVCIVLALVGAIGFIAKYTSGFTSSFKTFYISIDGKDIMISSEGYFLESNESMKVDIHYTFNDSDAEVSGYTVKIIPNVVDGRDFDFTVGDLVYSFQKEKDLTDGFIIEKGEDFFTITPKGYLTDILRAVYPDSEIADCTDKTYEDMFSLVVTSYNGESTVIVNFTVFQEPERVTFDKESIIF